MNVDEVSNKPDRADGGDAIDSSGYWDRQSTSRFPSTRPTSRPSPPEWRAASEAFGTRVGPPMLNSASLERLEALEIAAAGSESRSLLRLLVTQACRPMPRNGW